MKKTSIFINIVINYFLIICFCSCITLAPKEYVPDDKIVYLNQPFYLTAIKYPPEKAIPYTWPINVEIDNKNPSILSFKDFDKLLVPDLYYDAKIYNETKKHLLLMIDDPIYLELKSIIKSYTIQPLEQRKIITGEKVKDFTNAIEYVYPEISGAFITVYNDKSIKITFPNGNNYFYFPRDNQYFEKDVNGNELYAVFPDKNSFRIFKDGKKYNKFQSTIVIETSIGKIKKADTPENQFEYTPINKDYSYIFFIENFDNEKLISIALALSNSLRFDYIFKDDAVLIVKNENEAVTIAKNYEKYYSYFNAKTRKAEDLYSYYFPEGIRISDINKTITYSLVKPNWPENYLEKNTGSFILLYTHKDEEYLPKIDLKKLEEISNLARRTTGIRFSSNRPLILPPDLESYRRLYTGTREITINWYPSGFETKDIIVMWPPSVNRYEKEEGSKYFWEKEFYIILIHELTHSAVGEITGVFSQVPVWLNEGLAVYVESQWSDESKKYWNIVFDVSHSSGKLLNWDEVTINSTSYYPISLARIQYAQSYKMVSFLINKYGTQKLINYIGSFKTDIAQNEKFDLKKTYLENFTKIFGISWEENIKQFEESLISK
jgi:hypothetical protein